MPFGLSAGAIAAIGAGVSAAGTVASTLIQSGKSSSGASQANAAQTQALEQVRADLGPYNTMGQNALGVAGDLSGANGPDAATAAMKNFYTSPGYQFRLDEGLRGINANAAAQGAFRSGATVKAEQAYGQGLASSEFKDYYNRLYDLSRLGENAAAQQGNADLATGQGIAATDRNAAAQQGSIYGSGIQGISDTVGSLLSNPDIRKGLMGGEAGTPVNAINSLYTNPAEQAYFSAASTGSPYSFTG